MKNKEFRKFVLTYNGVPFSGFTPNGSQVVFGGTAVEYTKMLGAAAIKRKLEAVIKSKDDVVGLKEVNFPLNILIEVRDY
ncbi:MAG: hypothetical protein A2068_06025 [Ignavibacteria bacterium GWB2_35_6b]|nr:MAG: hypothetical protein A2068_06025 [Ignavibacteria bacterium GWB2_35_6b]